MISNGRKHLARGLGIFLTMAFFAVSALAGPPLICHAIHIGSAQSLPWSGDSWNLSGHENYDTSHLVPDTLALLTSSTPVLARMETLRRATLYAAGNSKVAKELILRLRARTTASESDALAAFDFGYLIECYRQMGIAARYGMFKTSPSGLINGVDGYSWVKKAIEMRGGDPQMEFAAALITSEISQQDRAEHLNKAIAGSKSDALLAENLESQFGNQTLAQHLDSSVAKNK